MGAGYVLHQLKCFEKKWFEELNPKPLFPYNSQNRNMNRVKCIEEIFRPFSSYEATSAIVHVQRNKSKACLPFVDQPAASNQRLGWLILVQPEHDQQENIAFVAIIRFQIIGDCQKHQHSHKLHSWIFFESVNKAECQIAKE